MNITLATLLLALVGAASSIFQLDMNDGSVYSGIFDTLSGSPSWMQRLSVAEVFDENLAVLRVGEGRNTEEVRGCQLEHMNIDTGNARNRGVFGHIRNAISSINRRLQPREATIRWFDGQYYTASNFERYFGDDSYICRPYHIYIAVKDTTKVYYAKLQPVSAEIAAPRITQEVWNHWNNY